MSPDLVPEVSHADEVPLVQAPSWPRVASACHCWRYPLAHPTATWRPCPPAAARGMARRSCQFCHTTPPHIHPLSTVQWRWSGSQDLRVAGITAGGMCTVGRSPTWEAVTCPGTFSRCPSVASAAEIPLSSLGTARRPSRTHGRCSSHSVAEPLACSASLSCLRGIRFFK